MKTVSSPIRALCVAAILTAPACAEPIWSYYNDGDAGFNALTNNSELVQGAVEGRIGNRFDIGTWELAIWRRPDVGPFLSLGQLNWGNGQAAPFSLVYDGGTTLSWMLGTTTISTTNLGGAFTDIFVRTRSAPTGSVSLSSMEFVGGISIGNLSSVGSGTVNYIRITNGATPFGAFELRGLEMLSWVANEPPINSQLGAQFRFTNVIPGPASSMGLACAAAWGARRRRR
jgi:hypothetical protein